MYDRHTGELVRYDYNNDPLYGDEHPLYIRAGLPPFRRLELHFLAEVLPQAGPEFTWNIDIAGGPVRKLDLQACRDRYVELCKLAGEEVNPACVPNLGEPPVPAVLKSLDSHNSDVTTAYYNRKPAPPAAPSGLACPKCSSELVDAPHSEQHEGTVAFDGPSSTTVMCPQINCDYRGSRY